VEKYGECLYSNGLPKLCITKAVVFAIPARIDSGTLVTKIIISKVEVSRSLHCPSLNERGVVKLF